MRTMMWMIFLAAACRAADPVGATLDGKAIFEKFKGLAGTWVADSDKGWKDETQFHVRGRGTAIEESTFMQEAERGMVTMYHLNGATMMLTHYCEAGNQPRMKVSRVEGNKVFFELLDITNLKPGAGYMRQAVFEFLEKDRFSSQWTFYKDGKEAWMEKVVYVRKR